MEIIVVLIGGFLLGVPVIAVVALVRSGNTRKLLEELSWDYRDKFTDLKSEIASLRRELTEVSQRAVRADTVLSTAPSNVTVEAKHAPASVKVTFEPARPIQEPSVARAIDAQPVTIPAPHASLKQTTPHQTARVESAAEPAPPKPMPPTAPPQASPAAPEASTKVDAVPVHGPAVTPVPQSRDADRPSQTPAQNAIPRFAAVEAAPPRKSFADRLRGVIPLEELLGMNLFAKLGIILLVLGFALLGRVALISMGPGSRVALIYAAASAMLGGGVWLESRERYRLVGRTGIGGGWALLFFTTYAMYHVPAMTVMSSNTLDCILMLAVAIAMVAHTLRYMSQLVTGLAFLLAFSTVALSQDSVYALAAGVILAVGIVAIALRMGWYELEVFGILASYSNHFYWLYKMYPDGMAGHPFPQFWPSAIILILYWAVFRVSYVMRRIRAPRDETISTIAALLNTILLGAIMKFQSTRPELAFFGILAIGAAEFTFGQLPVTRRRRPAFVLLTVMGTMLMFASVPFKFSGNNIAFFWMIAAEVLLIAGIVQSEVLFRRLGLLSGLITGLLIVYEARHLLEFRQHSESPLIQDGILLLTCSAMFYVNSLFVSRKWQRLFNGFDQSLVTAQSYIGCITAFLGVWGIFTGDSTAIGWSVTMLSAALGLRYLKNKHLFAQASALFVAVAVRAATTNCQISEVYPHHIAARLLTVPILASVFYITAWALSDADAPRVVLRSLSLLAGSSLLVTLVWLELPPSWVALLWMGLAVALAGLARRISVRDLAYEEHVLVALVAARLLAVNMDAQSSIERYLPFVGCAGALYAISRFCTAKVASYRRPAAWMHTWAATTLIAVLAWNESPQPWLAAIWAGFAIALTSADRMFEIEELPYQAYVLALLAVLRAVTYNMFTQEQWHGVDLRLITVSIVVAVLYAMARWVRLPEALRGSEARHAYTWAGSGLTAWLLWSELNAISVAVGLAVFGLLLFEFGNWQKQRQIRLQSYLALGAAFGRIFFVNLTAATLPGELLSPRIYTVAPIALIYFFVWAQLQSGTAKFDIGRWSASDSIAYLGTGSVAAVLYFQTPQEWIVVAWAVLVLALMAATLWLSEEVFQQQATLLALGVAARSLAHNIFGGSYFAEGGWRGNFFVLSLAATLLLATLPIAFRLRERYALHPPLSFLSRPLALKYPEQMFFFAPIVLITFMIAVKMNPGMITLCWGIEGVMVILLGLLVSQRSYRISGLFLLLLCVGKIVIRDAWRLDERDRYITFIALGAALTLVSALYGKYRETVRRLL